ncbi:hypothetical protein CKAH01_13006 [Colletotrichum kahawae]|uniref:Uncharacterized protein n=1 Tax=Colletotrichum kahawae TaxID=34407 RepID=A0AAD9YPE7_COLKA|nr:hypothetical protein CKAH01_13006 [Colletotrichum kahawae]
MARGHVTADGCLSAVMEGPTGLSQFRCCPPVAISVSAVHCHDSQPRPLLNQVNAFIPTNLPPTDLCYLTVCRTYTAELSPRRLPQPVWPSMRRASSPRFPSRPPLSTWSRLASPRPPPPPPVLRRAFSVNRLSVPDRTPPYTSPTGKDAPTAAPSGLAPSLIYRPAGTVPLLPLSQTRPRTDAASTPRCPLQRLPSGHWSQAAVPLAAKRIALTEVRTLLRGVTRTPFSVTSTQQPTPSAPKPVPVVGPVVCPPAHLPSGPLLSLR